MQRDSFSCIQLCASRHQRDTRSGCCVCACYMPRSSFMCRCKGKCRCRCMQMCKVQHSSSNVQGRCAAASKPGLAAILSCHVACLPRPRCTPRHVAANRPDRHACFMQLRVLPRARREKVVVYLMAAGSPVVYSISTRVVRSRSSTCRCTFSASYLSPSTLSVACQGSVLLCCCGRAVLVRVV